MPDDEKTIFQYRVLHNSLTERNLYFHVSRGRSHKLNKADEMVLLVLRLPHRSFYDFLANETRSGPYFIDRKVFNCQVLCRILELATISIKRSENVEGNINSLIEAIES
jgi:hypothetical protein